LLSREPTDAEIAINMDYTTRKKVAKSLIKRARMYQQQYVSIMHCFSSINPVSGATQTYFVVFVRDDLPTALQYYLKAQPYAADNLKLQHR
jgi:hypothetical protein